MKKIRRFLFLGVLILSIMLLSSCAVLDMAYELFGVEPQSADQLYERISRKTSEVSSYTSSGTGDACLYSDGVKINETLEYREIYSKPALGEMYHLSEVKVSVSIDTLQGTSYSEIRSGYCDGNAFLYSKDGGESNQGSGIYSKLSAGDYLEYIKDGDGSFSLGSNWVTDCSGKSFSHNEDGTWQLEFSDYDSDTLFKFMDSAGFTDGLIDHEVVDIEIILTADESFVCQTASICLVFDSDIEGDDKPRFNVNYGFGDFGTTEIETVDFGTDEYTEVLDIRVLDRFENAIDEITEKSRYTFDYSSESEIKASGPIKRTSGVDLVTFGEEDGEYFFYVSSQSEYSSNSSKSIFRDGKITTYGTGGKTENEMKVYSAKRMIRDMLSCGYDRYSVKGITKSGDDKYQIIMDVPNRVIVGSNVSAGDTEVTLVVTFKNDKISALEAHCVTECVVTSGYSSYNATITTDITIRYNLKEPVWENLLPTDVDTNKDA